MAQDHRPPLNEREAAAYIGMSVSYLRLSRMRGSTKCQSAPPFVRMGKVIRYLPHDLDDWLESRREFPAARPPDARADAPPGCEPGKRGG